MKVNGKRKLSKAHLAKLHAARDKWFDENAKKKKEQRERDHDAYLMKQKALQPSLILPGEFDWVNSDFKLATQRLADMRREYDRCASIMLNRQREVAPVIWPCWTQSHKDIVPKRALAECRKQVPDGKWVFKDDGYRDPETKMPAPIVCCSQLCYTAYQQSRPVGGLSRH